MSKNKWIDDLDDLDDLETPPEKESGSFSLAEWFSNLGQTPHLPWIAAGIAGVLLVIGLTLFWGDDEQDGASPPSSATLGAKDMQEVSTRLENLEARVSSLASRIKTSGQNQSSGDLDETLESLGMQLQNLENDFTRFKKQVSSQISALQDKAPAQASAGSPDSGSSPGSGQDGQEVYTVKKGDNLYRIGLKFDVSVEQLRSWNNLSPDSEIFPGQKLTVSAQ
ncbi:LysM peptidoglycan-binding domain-containing protein [Desulfovermiculus halophilus]|uniref:LysM peptidoglycan-binding domain-containing protein n=1 Tax=Desulfovermiculus halophilus TaxID=339722 RepID=UPI0004843CBF|nr:LysM domain-containing protein [Desulfovermiculus halophilus]